MRISHLALKACKTLSAKSFVFSWEGETPSFLPKKEGVSRLHSNLFCYNSQAINWLTFKEVLCKF
ncbi:MAG: hypothetical protein A2007_02940 [Verrucomicrobia bacterium GWC2_42_7]|nr:MAG: hypothetical protein A2007_02940 [Verrucomicrobia bacterium GWC2_42_7]